MDVSTYEEKLIEFCKRYYVRQLEVYGSLSERYTDFKQPLYITLDFDWQHMPGLTFFTLEKELAELLGRSVDLDTHQFLGQ